MQAGGSENSGGRVVNFSYVIGTGEVAETDRNATDSAYDREPELATN